MTSPESRIAELENMLAVAKSNARHWQRRYNKLFDSSATASAGLDLSNHAQSVLVREATLRGTTPSKLAAQLLANIADDNLFAAVLDR